MTSAADWDREELERAYELARVVRAIAGPAANLFAIRAPGRVNLIGEHTDYSGLPVLPVAIDRSTIVVAAPNASPEVELRNRDASFSPRRFRLARQIPPFAPGEWANYVKAAIQGVVDYFGGRGIAMERFRGATMAIDGRVPQAAGLSSSAALTVASALGFMAVNGLDLPPIDAASMVARSEWYVGTRAGGMDQAASMLARRDHAMFIEFNPLRVRLVRIPSDAALIVADSLEVADKSGKMRDEYNRRVVECALAARILARALKLGGVSVLGDVVKRIDRWSANNLVQTLNTAAPKRLGAGLEDAAQILGVSQEELSAEILGAGPSRIVLDGNRPLEILRRARHVLGETERVIAAVAALERGQLDAFGSLMNDSHASLADDFECSTERLDAMVECARRGGALGARLTGAGFGGSIVALSRSGDAHGIIEALDRGYYQKLGSGPHDQARKVLHAGPGASVIELES